MEELINALTEFPQPGSSDNERLRKVAKEWACDSLDNYTNELLSAALEISKALMGFVSTMENLNRG